MKARFTALAPARQRQMIILAAAVAVIAGLGLSLSLHGEVTERRQALHQADATLAEITVLAARYQALADAAAQTPSAAELAARVDTSLRQAGLQASSLQLEAGAALNLRFEAVDFNAVLDWLATVDNWPGVQVSSFSALPAEAGNARILLSLRGVDAGTGL